MLQSGQRLHLMSVEMMDGNKELRNNRNTESPVKVNLRATILVNTYDSERR